MPKSHTIPPELRTALARFSSFSHDLNLIFSFFDSSTSSITYNQNPHRRAKPTSRSTAWKQQRLATTKPSTPDAPSSTKSISDTPPMPTRSDFRSQALLFFDEMDKKATAETAAAALPTASVNTPTLPDFRAQALLFFDEMERKLDVETELSVNILTPPGRQEVQHPITQSSRQATAATTATAALLPATVPLPPGRRDVLRHLIQGACITSDTSSAPADKSERHWEYVAAIEAAFRSESSCNSHGADTDGDEFDLGSKSRGGYAEGNGSYTEESSDDPDYLPSDDTLDGSSSGLISDRSNFDTSSSEGDYDSNRPYSDHDSGPRDCPLSDESENLSDSESTRFPTINFSCVPDDHDGDCSDVESKPPHNSELRSFSPSDYYRSEEDISQSGNDCDQQSSVESPSQSDDNNQSSEKYVVDSTNSDLEESKDEVEQEFDEENDDDDEYESEYD